MGYRMRSALNYRSGSLPPVRDRRADEIVAKLKPGEVNLVIDTVQRWPECFSA
jgi:hypothetical protein